MIDNIFTFDSVELAPNGREVVILDQTLLPNQEKFLHLTSAEQIFYAITLLKVRGASAVGIAAAMGLAVCINRYRTRKVEELEKEFLRIKSYLYICRPTAINLMWTLDRMEKRFYEILVEYDRNNPDYIRNIKADLLREASAIKDEDIAKCLRIAEHGFSLLEKGSAILTHCNAGHLSTSRYGTALGPIYLAHQKGLSPKVYVGETRPLLQGSRLTSYELQKAGVDTTLLCDSSTASLMQEHKIDFVFAGADRIAANGDTANKIGTSSLAVLASYYKIPFYILAPTSTIDFNCPTGGEIVIEQRPSYEVTDMYFGKTTAPKGISVYNPSFDITPAKLIKGIITEKGIVRPGRLKTLFK